MFIDLSEQQHALRAQLRAYLGKVLSSEERAAMLRERHGGVYRDLVRRLGRDGWLGMSFPAEYGGGGLGPMEQQIFVNEATSADVPIPRSPSNRGPTLLAHGSDEQKAFFLPRDPGRRDPVRDRLHRARAGTDLAALRTRAVRDGDEYIVTVRRPSPPAPTPPTSCGWPAAPTPTPRGTRASRS